MSEQYGCFQNCKKKENKYIRYLPEGEHNTEIFQSSKVYFIVIQQLLGRNLGEVINLRTDNFFPKEAKSMILSWGETCKSLIDFMLTGSGMSSLSCGGNRLICKKQN